NGFQKEVRDRMLSVVAHVEILQPQGEALPDWRGVAHAARSDPQVGAQIVGAAPFIAAQALVARGDTMRGAVIRGIEPAEEATVTPLAAALRHSTPAKLRTGESGLV